MGRSINFSGTNRQCRMHNGMSPIAIGGTSPGGFNNPATFIFV
ncbi:hypothetical protein SAMN05444172_6274 [Burkholderia sp. GAS332]|nr:hypothetical protein SAMN05444172_6274 [Burkholderia sp. GAS332]